MNVAGRMRYETNKKVLARFAGFTLIELLVVIAIIALLVSILMPSLQKAKDIARAVACMANQRSIGLSMSLYSNDYEGYAPPAATGYFGYPFWDQYLVSFAGAEGGSFACPVKADPYPDADNYLGKWDEPYIQEKFGAGTPISYARSYTASGLFMPTEYNAGSSIPRFKPRFEDVDRLDQRMLALCWGSYNYPNIGYPGQSVKQEFYKRLNLGINELVHMEGDQINYLYADLHVGSQTYEELYQELTNPDGILLDCPIIN